MGDLGGTWVQLPDDAQDRPVKSNKKRILTTVLPLPLLTWVDCVAWKLGSPPRLRTDGQTMVTLAA